MRTVGFVLAALLLAGCTAGTTPPAPRPTPPQPPAPGPFDQAVLNAGNAVFTAAAAPGTQKTVVIDPLVNGVTGEQSNSTKTLGTRLAALAQSHYPQLKVLPFNARTVAQAD